MKLQVTTLDDYMDILYEKYPLIPKKDLRKIVKYGWSSFYNHLAYGGDIYLQDKIKSSYVGKVHKDPSKTSSLYIDKLAIKMRVLYSRKKVEHDGYFYFVLPKEQGELLLSDLKLGKELSKDTIYVYKIKDEASIRNFRNTYFFRVKLDKIRTYIKKVKVNLLDVELLEIRNPLTMKDVLVSNNNYELV